MCHRSLQELFHLVNKAVPEAQELIAVSAETLVQDALEVMFEKTLDAMQSGEEYHDRY